MMKLGKREWIEGLLFDLRENEGNPNDVYRLRKLLATDQEARLIYLQVNQMFLLLEMDHGQFPLGSSKKAKLGKLKRFSLQDRWIAHRLTGASHSEPCSLSV